MGRKQKSGNQQGFIVPLILIIIVLIIIGAVFGGDDKGNSKDTSKPSNEDTSKTEEKKDERVLAKKVQKALDKLGKDMKTTLAATSPGGYQGDIIGVKPYGSDGVKVELSTYFEDSGDGIDGGQGIARRIFTNICLDVPELNSLYVVSGSGLDSKSVYRSDFPFCK
jgi:hypothetical protein